MTVRNTLLTAAKAKKFDKDGFLEKLENVSGLNEKQWKENCRALIKQMDKLIKGKNISAGKHIAKKVGKHPLIRAAGEGRQKGIDNILSVMTGNTLRRKQFTGKSEG